MNDVVYLDNNASAPIAPECRDAVLESLRGPAGNPASKHASGLALQQALGTARAQVAALLEASPAEIVFTSGGTESNHLAILGSLAAAPEKQHVISCATEHPSTLLLLRDLQCRGRRVTLLGVDGNGQIDLAELERALDSEAALVTLSWANNETGVIAPMQAIANLVHARGVPLHVDAVQAIGKCEMDLAQVQPDLLSISGHKLHAPAGIGALYVRKGMKLPAQLFGHQERGRRGGTPNVSGIVALGVACESVVEGNAIALAHMAHLQRHLEKELAVRLPKTRINGGGAPRVVNTSNVCFGHLPAEVIVDRLDRAGIRAALGAACTAGGNEPSHVLLAMGLEASEVEASVRFSTSRYTSLAEIDRTVEVLLDIIAHLEAVAA